MDEIGIERRLVSRIEGGDLNPRKSRKARQECRQTDFTVDGDRDFEHLDVIEILDEMELADLEKSAEEVGVEEDRQAQTADLPAALRDLRAMASISSRSAEGRA